jgi:adenylate cyclase
MNAPRRGFFAELKRRKVVRVAVVYAATAFVILQAADIMLPRLGVPEWAMSLVVVLVVLGFPLALVLAWALELTPDGVRVTPATVQSDPTQSAPSLLGKRTLVVTGVLIVLGIGLGAGWFLRPTTTPIAREASIAVLPFVNMSASAENEYFSDGISEEILNLLAKVPGLQVAARTSSFAFKGRSEDASDIARQLRVGHVLEGSVRRAGDRVRITAQLIEADQGYHLWSEAYDRELADIFVVQDEIARAIVVALETHLGLGAGAELAQAPATQNPRAHDLYLVGLRDWSRRGDDPLRSALERFREAATLDPGYAAAHAGMALTYSVLPMYGEFPVAEAVREGKAAARRAIELRPDLPEAHAALGQIAQKWEWDWHTAEQAYARALELNPNYATAHVWRCELLGILGRPEESFLACTHALTLDPLAPVAHNMLGVALAWARRNDAARESYTRALELDPGFEFAAGNLSLTYLLDRGFDGWLRLVQQGAASAEERRLSERLYAGWTRPTDPEARAGAIEAIEGYRLRTGDAELHRISWWLIMLGENERALSVLEEAMAVPHLRPYLPLVTLGDPWAGLAHDPRYREVLRAMNLEGRR